MRSDWILKPSSLAAIAGLAAVVAIVLSSGLVSELARRWEDIAYLSQQHMALAAISGSLAVAVGVPAGILLSRPRFRDIAEPAMRILGLGSTLPSLAILALAMSFLGIGERPAIFALFVATLLPMMRNAFIGLLEVPRHLIEAADGMGMRPGQILWRVELPNALYVIMAGVRTAMAVNVGTVPLAFLIGAGGLGELIFTGIDLSDPGMMLAGAIPTAMLAVFTDFSLGLLTRAVVSRGVLPSG